MLLNSLDAERHKALFLLKHFQHTKNTFMKKINAGLISAKNIMSRFNFEKMIFPPL